MPLVEIGRPAPDFALAAPDGSTVTLADFRGRRLVLYFYPKNDTAGCTMEACNFRDLREELSSLGTAVVGISPDEAGTHEKFATKHALTFPVLRDVKDADGVPAVSSVYGVWVQKSLYGRRYWGVERTTYLLDADGLILKRWDRVRVPGHAAAVRDAIKALGARGEAEK